MCNLEFCKLSLNFSRKLCDRGKWNLFCIEYPYGLIYKKISSSSVTQYRRKVRCNLVKFQSCLLGRMCNFEFLQVIIAFFSKTMWLWNMKFGLHRVSIWVNIQTRFQDPRSHSIGEKCDAIFKISLHFSRKLCDRETWNLVCIEYPLGLIYKKNFKFLGHTVSEKNAMINCKISKLFIRANVQLWIFASYHRIFLENCVTDEDQIWFAWSIYMD